MSRRTTFPIMLSGLLIWTTLLGACASKPAASQEIILATTTSTQDTGLLDVLVPAFTQKTGITVKTVAVGTGQALKMGQDGEADVLLVHAPLSEKTFMEGGYGIERKLVMHNDFIIVGPAADPAGILGAASAVAAFKKIAAAGAPFISRGDDSGTNKTELAIWKKTEISPTMQTWYEETGQGMGATLKVASEKSAYTLTDRGTYLADKSSLGLDILVEGDNALLNIYHVIVVNPEKWPKVNVEGARAFSDFILSPEIQDLIGKFGVDQYGEPLFYADATKTDADFGLK
jgi:tungstate transport system substrate-binding protein